MLYYRIITQGLKSKNDAPPVFIGGVFAFWVDLQNAGNSHYYKIIGEK